jgi:hypothetical protein
MNIVIGFFDHWIRETADPFYLDGNLVTRLKIHGWGAGEPNAMWCACKNDCSRI